MSDMKHNYEIYLIEAPGYWYVGSTTVGAERRFQQHLAGQGGAKKLLKKIRACRTESFYQTVVETGHGDPIVAEQRWYDFCRAANPGESLNAKRPGGWDGWNFGKHHTLEARQKISDTKRGRPGRPVSPEARVKISNAQRGNTNTQGRSIHTVESRAKISAALAERVASPETRVKIGAARLAERAKCSECEMVTHKGPMARHQTATGHQGTVPCVV